LLCKGFFYVEMLTKQLVYMMINKWQ